MGKRDDNTHDPIAMCHVCRRKVPGSTAQTAEGRDYTYFFCGAGCRQRWLAEQRVGGEREQRR